MFDRPPGDGATRTDALKRAVDVALTVAVQTEWLASRPTIVPIIALELDGPAHVQTVTDNVHRLADDLDRTLEADPLVRHHQSDVVDAVFVAAVCCRLFVSRWTQTRDTHAERFNVAVMRLRHDIDQVMGSLTD